MQKTYPSNTSSGGKLSCPRVLLALAVLLTGFGLGSKARAQSVYGSIVGTVTDATGASVPHANITVTDVAKGTTVKVQSNDSGEYTVQHLISDVYRVVVEAPGFAKATREGVQVYVDTAPKVDVQLSAGAETTTVNVSSEAPVLQTERADVSTILNERAVENLPNLNRNFTAFELLTPGTSYIGWNVGESSNPQRSQQIEVDGQLPFATGYELDGTDNQDPINGIAVINPNLDAVSEMKVTSQNYDAEQGKAVAGLVTAQTRSGSNALHGSAFEFRRSDAQQARDPFTEYAPAPITGRYIPSNLHNQFGGSVGGPIRRDRLFFFGDYQGLREKTGSAQITTVPTALARTTCSSGGDCNLSDYLQPGAVPAGSLPNCGTQFCQGLIFDPATNLNSAVGRSSFPGNIIPAGRLSTPAVNFFKLLPAPNTGTAGQIVNNFIAAGTGSFNTDQFDVRVDGRAGQNLHLFGRYTRFDSNLSGAPYFGGAGGAGFANGFAGTDTSLQQSLASGGDYTFSARWSTDFRFGWYRIYLNEEGPGYNQALGNQLGIPNTNVGDLSLNGGLPQFDIQIPSNGSNGSGSLTYGTSANQNLQDEDQFQIVDNWSHSVGNHNVRFGADLRYALNHIVSVQNNTLRSGLYNFVGQTTSGAPSPAVTVNSGVGFASFLLGDINFFSRSQTFSTDAAERQKRTFFYAQDQWRVTKNLTLNYGLRDEIYFPETVNGPGNGGLLDLNAGIVRIAGVGPWATNLNVGKSWTTLAPRLGIAYQPMASTVLRAGYGRVYGQGWSGNTFGLVLTDSYPIQYVQNINAANGVAPIGFNLSQGPPAAVAPSIPSNGSYVLPDGIQESTRPLYVRIPTLDAWNVALQQTLSPTLSLQITYVASHAVHNMFDSSNEADANQPTIAGFNNCGSTLPITFGPGCSAASINPLTNLPYTTNDRRPFYNGSAQALGAQFGTPHGWTQSFRYNANEATSSYQALQVVLEKHFSHGLQFLSHYTWAHALAHESDYFFIDKNADYGNSYYNRRNVFLLSGNYDLPFGRNKQFASNVPGVVNQIIGGFALNGTLTWESGLPFTPNYASCAADQDVDTGGSLCRPSKSGIAPDIGPRAFDPIAHRVKYFTAAPAVLGNGQTFGSFTRPAFATFGNYGRDSLWGPHYIDTDFSVAKSFFLTERATLQFRAESFNLFNHPNLGGPDSCVDCQDGNAGTISGIVASQDGTTMRRLQFAARIQF